MLFNSIDFIFIFLPFLLLAYWACRKIIGDVSSILVLAIGSIIFYGWWNLKSLPILLASIFLNFAIGVFFQKARKKDWQKGDKRLRKTVLVVGVAANLLTLGYFKYANFFAADLLRLDLTRFDTGSVVLPLAISFFTFQQIAYLVDSYRGLIERTKVLHYLLFVTFFPQLIAGPIVHYKEMMPQFLKIGEESPILKNLVIALPIFGIGLFKKVVIADSLNRFNTPIYSAALSAEPLTFLDGWAGAFGYTFEIYFDFSAYTDMAVALALMFGIKLPINFFSPYKSSSIIDFWRTWHISLSRFLRDYLYIPLGGSTHGGVQTSINLMITMLLGGLWHGAGFNFLWWGALHGLALLLNHRWRVIFADRSFLTFNSQISKVVSWTLTFLFIVVSWVLFRCETIDSAIWMYSAMLGFNGITLPAELVRFLPNFFSSLSWLEIAPGYSFGQRLNGYLLPLCVLCLVIVTLSPNIYQLFPNLGEKANVYRLTEPRLLRVMEKLIFQPNLLWALITTVFLSAGLFVLLYRGRIQEFIYWQF